MILVLLGVMVALAVGLSFWGSGQFQEERAVAMGFCLLACTFGPLVAYFHALRRGSVHGPVWERLAYAAVTALFMIPALGVAGDVSASVRHLRTYAPGVVSVMDVTHDEYFARILVAPLAVLLVCDWTRRIETGRGGQVRGRDAFWPAAVGLVTAGIARAEGFAFVAASLCAAMSLLTQAAAAMWPYVDARGLPGVPPWGHGFGGRRGGRHRRSAPPPSPEGLGRAGTGEASRGEQSAAAPVIVDASAPVLLRGGVNAGLSLLGRLLLFVGLVLILGQATLLAALVEHFEMPPGLRRLCQGLPGSLLLGLLVLGSLLLVLARRGAGGAHLARGCLGCALLLWGAVMALGPAAAAITHLYAAGDLSKLDWGRLAGPLGAVAIPLLLGLLLLIWPKRQAGQTIVV